MQHSFYTWKWNSNEPALEEPVINSGDEETYAKKQIGKAQGGEWSSLLGKKHLIQFALLFCQNQQRLLSEELCKNLSKSTTD